MKTPFGLLLALLALAVSCSTTPSSRSARIKDTLPPLPKGQEWRLVWQDEFDGATLDDSKWERMGDYKRRDGFWVKDDAGVDGRGCLVLRTKRDGDRFTCGSIRTLGKYEHRYGYWAGDITQAHLPDEFLVDYVRVYDPMTVP